MPCRQIPLTPHNEREAGKPAGCRCWPYISSLGCHHPLDTPSFPPWMLTGITWAPPLRLWFIVFKALQVILMYRIPLSLIAFRNNCVLFISLSFPISSAHRSFSSPSAHPFLQETHPPAPRLVHPSMVFVNTPILIPCGHPISVISNPWSVTPLG